LHHIEPLVVLGAEFEDQSAEFEATDLLHCPDETFSRQNTFHLSDNSAEEAAGDIPFERGEFRRGIVLVGIHGRDIFSDQRDPVVPRKGDDLGNGDIAAEGAKCFLQDGGADKGDVAEKDVFPMAKFAQLDEFSAGGIGPHQQNGLRIGPVDVVHPAQHGDGVTFVGPGGHEFQAAPGKRDPGAVEAGPAIAVVLVETGDASFSSQEIGRLMDAALELAMNDYDLKKRYDFRRIEIVRHYDGEIPLVPCEATNIQQIFLNIVKNAAYALADKQFVDDAPRLMIAIRADEQVMTVEIADNGPGMDEKTRKRIFEPFSPPNRLVSAPASACRLPISSSTTSIRGRSRCNRSQGRERPSPFVCRTSGCRTFFRSGRRRGRSGRQHLAGQAAPGEKDIDPVAPGHLAAVGEHRPLPGRRLLFPDDRITPGQGRQRADGMEQGRRRGKAGLHGVQDGGDVTPQPLLQMLQAQALELQLVQRRLGLETGEKLGQPLLPGPEKRIGGPAEAMDDEIELERQTFEMVRKCRQRLAAGGQSPFFDGEMANQRVPQAAVQGGDPLEQDGAVGDDPFGGAGRGRGPQVGAEIGNGESIS